MHTDRGPFARVTRRSKLRLKFRGSIGVPWRVVNTRLVSIQASPARSRSASLKLPAQLERGDAQVQCLELPLERRRRSIGWTLIAVAFPGRATGLAISVGAHVPEEP